LVSTTRRDACVIHIYPTGPGMGTRYPLSDAPVVLGRGNDCDIRINDHSVSRRHARIQPAADGYFAVDLRSTNGTFVNDVPASMCKLQGGDYTLRELAAVVKGGVRKEELFARYGGEEFAVVLPETSLANAVTVGERVRSLVQNHVFRYEGKEYGITVSAGVTGTTGDTPLTPNEIIRQADEKLYQAKTEGRNRVAY